jgi:hypothetical protein
LAKLEQRLVQQ